MDTLLEQAHLDQRMEALAHDLQIVIDECGEHAPNKFWTLINYVSHYVYDYIEDCADYDAAIEALTHLYINASNEIFARHPEDKNRVKFSLNPPKNFVSSAMQFQGMQFQKCYCWTIP